jgi:Peptidase S24-like
MTDAGERGPDPQRALATFALHRSVGAHAWVEVAGMSMQPLIRPGDRLYVEFGTGRPRLGEILVFAEDGRFLAHRLVRRRRASGGEMLVTRGDGTMRSDQPFPASGTFGVVRACRRGDDGAPTPILDHGLPALLIASFSALSGYGLNAAEQLPPSLGRPLGIVVSKLAPALINRSARAFAWSARRFGSAPWEAGPVVDANDELARVE